MPDAVFYCAGVPIAVQSDDGTLRRVALSDEDRDRIEDFLRPNFETPWLPSLLTDEMERQDADRMRRQIEHSIGSVAVPPSEVVTIPRLGLVS